MANHNDQLPLTRTIVLVGMPGAGKTSVGKRLAARLNIPFVDSDQEVEIAAGMSVPEIFEKLGEPAFREGERKVIARLMQGEPKILSTGGGAFMNEQTRQLIKDNALSLWLKADFDVLLERVSRTNDRPLLKKGDPATILRSLQETREPVYALADLTVSSDESPLEVTVNRVITSVSEYLNLPSLA